MSEAPLPFWELSTNAISGDLGQPYRLAFQLIPISDRWDPHFLRIITHLQGPGPALPKDGPLSPFLKNDLSATEEP